MMSFLCVLFFALCSVRYLLRAPRGCLLYLSIYQSIRRGLLALHASTHATPPFALQEVDRLARRPRAVRRHVHANYLSERSKGINGPSPGLFSDGITAGSHVAGCACSRSARSLTSKPRPAAEHRRCSPNQVPPAFTAPALLQQHPADRNGEDGTGGSAAVGTEGTYSARWASIRGGDR